MTGAAPSAQAVRMVKSAHRTIDVLEALSVGGEMTLSELTRQLGIPKSSLHGILATLRARRWIQADPAGQRFRVGLGAVLASNAVLGQDEVVVASALLMDWLAAQTGETVQLARLDGHEVVYLAKRQSAHPVSLVSAVGSRLPAHATALGKALLCERTTAQLDDVLSFPLPAATPRTIRSRQDLLEELALTQQRGYAVDNEEMADHLRCYAVTLPWATPATDAVSVSVPTFRLNDQTEADIVRLLLELRGHAGRQALTSSGERAL